VSRSTFVEFSGAYGEIRPEITARSYVERMLGPDVNLAEDESASGLNRAFARGREKGVDDSPLRVEVGVRKRVLTLDSAARLASWRAAVGDGFRASAAGRRMRSRYANPRGKCPDADRFGIPAPSGCG
jgi:hypothetical protein